MLRPHDKIITDAAKAALVPLNFRRKGRSRLWFADHGWWLAVIEFQPSSWSKGSYLNIGAHWLWSEMDYVSFDFGSRSAEFVEYQSEAQFTPAAFVFAESAAQEARRLADTFVSLDATAKVLLDKERAAHGHARGGWTAYHAGVAAGIVGRTDDAVEMFDRVQFSPAPAGSILHSAATHMTKVIAEPFGLRHEAAALIGRHREVLRLPALAAPAF